MTNAKFQIKFVCQIRPPPQTHTQALAEAANKDTYNKNTDPENYSGPIRKYVEFGNFCNEFIVGKYEAWFNGFILSCICVAGVLVGMSTYEREFT